jgi:hypothetical protein
MNKARDVGNSAAAQRGLIFLHPLHATGQMRQPALELQGIEMGIGRTIVSVRLVGPVVVGMCGRRAGEVRC